MPAWGTRVAGGCTGNAGGDDTAAAAARQAGVGAAVAGAEGGRRLHRPPRAELAAGRLCEGATRSTAAPAAALAAHVPCLAPELLLLLRRNADGGAVQAAAAAAAAVAQQMVWPHGPHGLRQPAAVGRREVAGSQAAQPPANPQLHRPICTGHGYEQAPRSARSDR